MALDHPDAVRSLTLASSFAKPDAYLLREFAVPGAERVVLPGGHMIHDEEPERFFESVRRLRR
jgi:hypothetical protein